MMNFYNPAETLAMPTLGQEPPPFQWLPGLLQFLRRRWPTILTGALILLGLAVAYLQVATPQYTAGTSLLIDLRRTNPFRQQPIVADAQYENALIEGQVEVLRSEGLARLVVQRVDLANDPVFKSLGPGIIGSVIQFFTRDSGRSGGDDTALRQALTVERLMRMVAVRRIGLTGVIEITVRTPDPDLSARLANAMAEAYLEDQLSVISSISSRASTWLQSRLVELRDEAIAADRAVQDYKARANILDTDRGQFDEQQLGELSTQLTTARARLADAQSKFDRIRSLTTERVADASVSEALESAVIVGLRRQYLDARRREAEWSARYGNNHAAAVNARAEMAELQRSIQNELNRISETYKSELAVAKDTAAQIERQLAELAASYAAANADRIMLRSLQSSADSYRTIYENFLQRYTQAVQDQSFPIPEARVVTAALPPRKPSQPKTMIVLGLGLILGIMMGTAAAVLRELLDRGLRTPAQVKVATGHDCLGLLPRLSGRLRLGGGTAADQGGRLLATRPTALRHIADQPASPFAEAIRGLALRTTGRRRGGGNAPQVIGVTAARPGEGASTIAANLAQAFAEAGYATLLVDLDLRGSALTRALAPQNAGGTAELAEGNIPLDTLVWRDPETGLHFLPAAAERSTARIVRVLAPARAERLVASFRSGYERVVIDLPALGAADVQVLAELLDGILLVANWGGMDGQSLAALLDGFQDGPDKLLGIVLNRVELRRLGSYGVPDPVLPPRPDAHAAA